VSAILQPGDVFLTCGKGFKRRAIRSSTRRFGKKRTKVHHVGLVVEGGDLMSAIIVEAVSRVKRHKLWSAYGPPKEDSVAIYRATNLSQDEIDTIVGRAESHIGKRFGYPMIVAHVLDWLLLGAYVFRHIVPGSKYPICSWVVADAFGKAGKYFGVEVDLATPDDIWDFVVESTPSKYEQIHPLKKLA
jgi:hypothetical protein